LMQPSGDAVVFDRNTPSRPRKPRAGIGRDTLVLALSIAGLLVFQLVAYWYFIGRFFTPGEFIDRFGELAAGTADPPPENRTFSMFVVIFVVFLVFSPLISIWELVKRYLRKWLE